MSGYGWIIDQVNQELFDEKDKASGPWSISDCNMNLLDAGEGVKFKMYDDDDEWYFTGRIIGDYDGLEPLDEWGAPYAGCTEIRYRDETGKWVML